MRTVANTLCMLAMIACVPEAALPLFQGRLPPDTRVDLAGTFALSPAGDLSLALAAPCTFLEVDDIKERPAGDWVPCHGSQLNAVHVVASAPWGVEVPGVWIDAEHLVFQIDWKVVERTVPEADLPALVARPWLISGRTWTPSTDEVRQILRLISDALSVVVYSGPRPGLEVTRFDVEGGTLRAGGESTLIVQITNHGPGTAYRVIATVSSGIMSLHGVRLYFGMIKPNTEKDRRIPLTVPISENSPDTMLVVAFDEGNGFSPPRASRRVPIAAPAIAPVLAVRCAFPHRSLQRPELDAGEDVVVRCLVDNSGTGAANVVVEASIDGARSIVSTAKRVAPAGNASFDLPLSIPRGLAIDSVVQLAFIARDQAFARSAQTTLVGVIRQPKLCAAGQLTHTQYHAKLAALRAARAAGDLTQAQFDRYDVELVTCLNDKP